MASLKVASGSCRLNVRCSASARVRPSLMAGPTLNACALALCFQDLRRGQARADLRDLGLREHLLVYSARRGLLARHRPSLSTHSDHSPRADTRPHSVTPTGVPNARPCPPAALRAQSHLHEPYRGQGRILSPPWCFGASARTARPMGRIHRDRAGRPPDSGPSRLPPRRPPSRHRSRCPSRSCRSAGSSLPQDLR